VTRRPGYAPGDLLKLYIYGYLNRVRSSRRLEMESHALANSQLEELRKFVGQSDLPEKNLLVARR
jgi:transposase